MNFVNGDDQLLSQFYSIFKKVNRLIISVFRNVRGVPRSKRYTRPYQQNEQLVLYLAPMHDFVKTAINGAI
jgi:hypothetical protein